MQNWGSHLVTGNHHIFPIVLCLQQGSWDTDRKWCLLWAPSMYSSQPFWHQEPVWRKTVFPWTWWRDGFQMIEVHDGYCALYFWSNAAADLTGGTGLWPRGGEPLCAKLKSLAFPSLTGPNTFTVDAHFLYAPAPLSPGLLLLNQLNKCPLNFS